MGELILCNQMLAALPYYMEDISLNIYSLEELSYYIENNTCLLTADFMCEELCSWIEQELAQVELAEMLGTILKRGRTLSEFVECLLVQTGYCSRESLRKIVATLKEMEQKPAYECCKIRADRYVENQKYVKGIHEYQRYLRMEEAVQEHPALTGDVWHNLGTAYARLLFYEEALDCYRKAYQLNRNARSLEGILFAYQCLQDLEGFHKTAEEYEIPEVERSLLLKRYESAAQAADIMDFDKKLEDVFAAQKEADMSQKIAEILEDWKMMYQRNCTI